MKQRHCDKCKANTDPEDLVQFWEFRICYSCNRDLARVLRSTVNSFIGITESNKNQMGLPFIGWE